MKAEFINPFINAATNVLGTMCQLDTRVEAPRLKGTNTTWGAVTGLVGMASENISGNLVLSFSETAILHIVSAMLMEQFTEINSDVVDAVGELTNMVCGGAKKELSEAGYSFNMATPIMIAGAGIAISQLSKTAIIQIPMEIPAGKFVIESCMGDVKSKV